MAIRFPIRMLCITDMNLGRLLEELIDIAKKPKTDFAISMNMTPSGLSKILTGSRLPVRKEKKVFIKLAADYFSEYIYSHACYLKFKDLFPVIYDFKSLEDLRSFLTYAIEYALDKDLATANQVNLEFVERGFYFLGRKSVLNLLCVMLSDHLVNDSHEPLEVYSAIPTYDPAYSEIFLNSLIVNPERCTHIVFNHFFDGSLHESSRQGKSVSLNFISVTQRGFNLNLWATTSDLGQPFLLLKGKLLLMFDSQIDGTPLLIPIAHKNYLNLFYNSLMNKDIRKISYSRSEAIAFCEENRPTVTALFNQGIDTVFNFTSIGYLLREEEINSLPGSEKIGNWAWLLFQHIMNKGTEFYVSLAAMERFAATGKAVVPFIGAYSFPDEQRAPYMQRFNQYLMEEDSFSRIRLLDSHLSNMAILCAGNFCLIYAVDDEYALERIHIFDRAKVSLSLEKMIKDNKLVDFKFSSELWSTYQESLLNNV